MTGKEELSAVFKEQAEALKEGGVDMILLETFSHSTELLLAAEAVSSVGLPVCTSFTLTEEGYTPGGESLRIVMDKLNKSPAVQIIGLNCGTGPSHLYEWVQEAMDYTKKPVIIMPNAGFPRELDGRMIYLSNPEYFSEYAKKFMELGVRGVGGLLRNHPRSYKDCRPVCKIHQCCQKTYRDKSRRSGRQRFPACTPGGEIPAGLSA